MIFVFFLFLLLFDPIATKEAWEIGLEITVINEARLKEFSNYIDGKPFVGAIVS